jgi:ferric-dicitrate binding protein FerR (iron transport regulator)
MLNKDFKHIVDYFFSRSKKKSFEKGNVALNNEKDKKSFYVTMNSLRNIRSKISDDVVEQDLETIWKTMETRKKSRLRLNWLKYVAVALVLITVSYNLKNVVIETHKLAYTEYLTEEGESSKIKLPDGTVITLKENSSLRIPNNFSKMNRSVEFKGDAFFEVYHNSQSEFHVNSGKYLVKVLGTKFNIRNYELEDYLTTTLKEGVVISDFQNITNKKSDFVKLKEYQKVIFHKKTHKRFLYNFKKQIKIDWAKNSFVFYDNSLAEILNTLSIYFNFKVEVENKEILKTKYTAKFKNKSLIEILESLKEIRDFQIIEKENLLVLK